MAEGVPVTVDCCPYTLGCLHCPECGQRAMEWDDPDLPGSTPVLYDDSSDSHYVICPEGHRFWFREKVAT